MIYDKTNEFSLEITQKLTPKILTCINPNHFWHKKLIEKETVLIKITICKKISLLMASTFL